MDNDIRMIKTRIIRGSEVTIYIDSQTASKTLDSHTIQSGLLSDCKVPLMELSGFDTIILFLVPEHCNVQRNEIADELARQGSDLDVSSKDWSVKPPIGYYYRWISDNFRDSTNRSWHSRMDCRVSRYLWPNLNKIGTEEY